MNPNGMEAFISVVDMVRAITMIGTIGTTPLAVKGAGTPRESQANGATHQWTVIREAGVTRVGVADIDDEEGLSK